MHAWEAIQKAVDYIEENLDEDISTEGLAGMVSLSPFYFQRHFTRAFKETYGITPEEYKKTHPMLNTVMKPEISMDYVLIDEGVPLITGIIVLEIQRKCLAAAESYIGFETDVTIAAQTPVGESTGMDIPGQLWTRFHKEKSALADYVNPAIELGMSYMADQEKGTFKYFAGAQLQNDPLENDPGTVNTFVMQQLSAGDYIVCRIEAENFQKLVTEALDKGGKYLFGTWLPNHQLSSEPFSAEKYYMDGDCGYCVEIWVKPLDKIF